MQAIEFFDKDGRTMVPAAVAGVLMLGPGTSITHEAVKTLTDNGCLIVWVGEQGVRFYAQGSGETRKGYRLLRQAELVLQSRSAHGRGAAHVPVSLRLHPGTRPDHRAGAGIEGARVRKAYQEASHRFGVPGAAGTMTGASGSSVTRSTGRLSTANACLNSLCHAAIVSAGYAPGLGFIHTGKQLSFVYDIADLYKVDLTVPLAFRLTAESTDKLETRVRYACRDLFHAEHLMGRIVDDMDKLLEMPKDMDEPAVADESSEVDSDPALPTGLWSPD